MEVPLYEDNLNVDESVDLITMDKCFDYESVANKNKVKFVVTRMKGHALSGWMVYKLRDKTKARQE